MRVVHVVASVNANTGGPSQSVTQLARSLAERGETVRLVSLDYSRGGAVQPIGDADMELLPARFSAVHFRGFSPRLAARINEVASDFDVIHNHGLWMWPNLYARIAASRNDKPLVVSPRGMLDPWARRRGRLKKALFWQLFERGNLARAAMFHATSHEEAAGIRELQLDQPIAIIPNAVQLPVLDELPTRGLLESCHPELRDKRWLLFLSRVHTKKGVRELLSAWRDVHPDLPDWHLIIAGDLHSRYGQSLVEQVRRQPVPVAVTLVGQLEGKKKSAALRHADMFVLPSFSENFGIAIAEALAHATPVITTTATPWREIADVDAGWCIEPGETPLRAVLPVALGRSVERLAKMGLVGRQLIAARHNWKKVASEMAAAYHWLIDANGATPPDFVLTERCSDKKCG